MKFDDLLQMKGIDPAKCRYLRHASSELSSAGWENNPAALFRDNRIDIEDYQSILKRGQLDGYDYAISLAAFGGGRALFLGIYQIVERNLPFVTHPRYKEFNETFGWDCYTKSISGRSSAYHKLEFTDTLAEYSGRLVISWSGQRFIQNASYRREVVEIMEEGSVGTFPGYDNILLGRADFEELLNNPRANAQWYTALSKVGGVYLIITKEGEQYVGSAYGKGGIWGRWAAYAKNPTGGNKLLKKLIATNSDAFKHFTYSILSVVSGDKKLVLEAENRWKRKLGTRAYGLNDN